MPKKLTGFNCPHCDDFIEEIDVPDKMIEVFVCDNCGELYKTEDEAKECCA